MGASLLSSVSLSNVAPFVCLVLVVLSKTPCEQDDNASDLRDEYFDQCVLNISNSTEGRRGQAWYNYTQINILSLIPCTKGNPKPSEGKKCDFIDYLPILAMVEDEINENDDILKGYRLKLSNIDSGCHGDRASLNYFKDVTDTLSGNGSVKHMIMGPACTVATEPVAGLGNYMNMSQVSYTASGPQFAENRSIYSRFYTMQPLITLYNDAYLAIFERYKWKRIAIIHQVDPLFTKGANDLNIKARMNGIIVEHFGNFVEDPRSDLETIKTKDIRIIVALFNPVNPVAVKIWCEASSMGLTDAHHVWFTPVWAKVQLGGNSCGNETIEKALNFSFGTLGSDMRVDKDTLLVSNKTVQNVTGNLECYRNLYNGSEFRNCSPSVTVKEGYVYDSVWAIALALNDTIAQLEANGSVYKLEDFQYSNIEMADMMLENLQAVNFSGLSGHIVFDGNDSSNTTGNRLEHIIEIRQYNGTLDTELVAYYHTNDKTIHFVDGDDFNWRGGRAPPDRPKPDPITYAKWAVAISCLSSGAGVILSLVCLTFTVYYRKHRVFKRATPRLNVMICLGTIVGFSSSFLYSMVLNFYQDLPHTKPNLTGILFVCNLVNWLTYIGFTLAFGSLLMKTWRLYRIFYNPEIRKRKYLEDRFLILGVIGMLVIVLIILAVWTGVAHTKWCESTAFSEDRLKEYRFFRCCASDDSSLVYKWYIFLGIMGIAFAIVLLFGMFMAYQIKKNLGRMLHKYTETPLINISAVMALTFSSIFLILPWVLDIKSADTLSSLLLLVALRDGFWMYPMLLILYIPMAYELVQDKRGKRRRFSSRGSIASHVEAFSQRQRRDSSFSNSSYSLDERRPSFTMSNTSSASSSKPPRPLSPLEEEIGTEVQEGSSVRDSGDVTPNTGRVSFAVDKTIGEDEVFNPSPSDRHHNASPMPLDTSNRRPSILKSGPLIDMRKTDQHVKFTVSK